RVPGGRGALRRGRVPDQAVLVRRPHGAVAPHETGAGALLAAEAARAIQQTGYEPLEADRHFVEPAAEPIDDAIDEAATNQSLADGGVSWPLGTVRKQGADRHRQVVVRGSP